jgi:hypothetical protein
LRDRLDTWIEQTGDMGEIPEHQMVERMWPNGLQPRTEPTLMIPITFSNSGRRPVSGRVTLEAVGPASVVLSNTGGVHCLYLRNRRGGPLEAV